MKNIQHTIGIFFGLVGMFFCVCIPIIIALIGIIWIIQEIARWMM